MPKIVRMPNGDLVRMPDDLDDAEIKALIEHKFPDFAAQQAAARKPAGPSAGDYVSQGLSGVNTGLGQVLGAPMDIGNGLVRLADWGLTKMGADIIPDRPVEAVGGASTFIDPMKQAGMIKPESQDPGLQGVRRIGEEVGGFLIPGGKAVGEAVKVGKGAETAAKMIQAALMAGEGRNIAHAVDPNNPWLEIAGGVIGGAGLDTAISLMSKRAAQVASPTIAQLEDQAGQLYDQAKASKLVVSQPAATTFIDRATAKAMTEGLDETLTPGTTAAIKRMQAMAGRPMSIDDATLIRKLLQAAAKGNEPKLASDRRIATLLIHDLDGFLVGLAKKGPQGQANLAVASGDAQMAADSLSQANAIYTRAKKGEMIDTAIELAYAKADKIGLDSALRNEFAALERQIIKGQLKGLSDDEIAAIKKVAHGGALENVARYAGKFAPDGVISAAASGGIPFAAGNAVAGPLVGAAAAGSTMLATILAKKAAAAMTGRNAQIMQALTLRGAKVPKTPLFSDEQQQVINALMTSEAANQNDKMPWVTVGTKGAPTFQMGGH